MVILGMDYTDSLTRNFQHQGNLEIPSIQQCINLFCKHHDISPDFISPDYGNMKLVEEVFKNDENAFEYFHAKMGMKRLYVSDDEEEEEEEEENDIFISPGAKEERISDIAWREEKKRRREDKEEEII